MAPSALGCKGSALRGRQPVSYDRIVQATRSSWWKRTIFYREQRVLPPPCRTLPSAYFLWTPVLTTAACPSTAWEQHTRSSARQGCNGNQKFGAGRNGCQPVPQGLPWQMWRHFINLWETALFSSQAPAIRILDFLLTELLIPSASVLKGFSSQQSRLCLPRLLPEIMFFPHQNRRNIL